MSTMREVAKKAGVSKATVSRVLSGKGYVSETTKNQVHQAIEQTGYRPNLLARNLSTSTSQCIGLVATNSLYSGSHFNELISLAAKKLEANGRQLILMDGKHSARDEQEAIEFLLDLRCDAIIIYPRFLTIEAMDNIIEQYKQPIMVVNRKLRKNQSHSIFCDNKEAAFNATSYLVSRGHRNIAFITGTLDSPTAIERISGYKEALNTAEIGLRDELIIQGKWTPASGESAIQSLLDDNINFTAVLASNDDMAIGAIKKLTASGILVPAEISVIGFDDNPIAPYLVPPLTSIKTPISDMISEVINRLLAMLDGGFLSKDPLFKSSLIIRDSVSDGPFAGRVPLKHNAHAQ